MNFISAITQPGFSGPGTSWSDIHIPQRITRSVSRSEFCLRYENIFPCSGPEISSTSYIHYCFGVSIIPVASGPSWYWQVE
jgi:hypothetical protein